MGQAEVVVAAVQGQLLAQAVFALAQGGDAPADRCYMLTDGEVQAVTVDGGIAPSTSASSRVENWRAYRRWRVSSPTLSLVGWVHRSTIVTFPAPATSNAACGFPALRFPA
jgi:hypothetical protein